MVGRMTLSMILALGTMLLTAADARSELRWGALAVCPKCCARGGSLAWSFGHATADQARQAVRKRVLAQHMDVKVLLVTSDRYIVVMFARNGSIGYESDDDERRAFLVAERDCRNAWGSVAKFLRIDNVASKTSWGAPAKRRR